MYRAVPRSYHGPVTVAVLLVPVGYLVGMFPTAQLVGVAAGHDPTVEGSGNPGASNVYRLAGRKAGAAVFAGDLLKAVLAAGAGYAAGGRSLAMACGVAAVVGHVFPVTRGGRGGRGVASGAGVVLVLFPLVAVGAALAWFAVARASHKASVASLAVAAGVPVAVAGLGRPAWEPASVAGLALLIVARHAPNLRRLAQGREQSLRGGERR